MRNAVNAGNIHASASSPEEADLLRADFADLIFRVNVDLATQRVDRKDQIGMESAIAQVERSIDYHLRLFDHNLALQSLAPEIKFMFRQGIQAQIPGTP